MAGPFASVAPPPRRGLPTTPAPFPAHAVALEAAAGAAAQATADKTDVAPPGHAAGGQTPHLPWTPLQLAAAAGDVEVVDRLMRRGGATGSALDLMAALLPCDVRTAPGVARDPMLVPSESVMQRRLDVLRCLLTHGCSCDEPLPRQATAWRYITIFRAWSPLALVSHWGSVAGVAALLQAGASGISPPPGRMQPLVLAAAGGHTDVCAALLDAGASLHMPQGDDLLPLPAAAGSGSLDTVRFLAARCGLLARGERELPPVSAFALVQAATHGHSDVMEYLLGLGVSPDAVDEGGVCALCAAAEAGEQAAALQLLDAGATPTGSSESNKAHDSPLACAARGGCLQLTQRLLAAAPVHPTTLRLALEGVSSQGSLPCAQALLAALPADTHHATFLHRSVLTAAEAGHVGVLEALLLASAPPNASKHNGCSALWLACAKGHVDCVKVLLGAGADVNAETSRGSTPLTLAAEKCGSEIVRLLIDAGADVHATTNAGTCSVYFAAHAGHADNLRLLLAAGAGHSVRKRSGDLPLITAARNGHAECVQVLLEAGADPNDTMQTGATAIQAASLRGHTEAVRALLAGGATPDKRSGKNLGALGGASERGHTEIVRLLLAAGVSPDAAYGKSENTGLWLASRWGKPDVVQVLLEAGADPNFITHQGHNTALCAACCYKHWDIAGLLLEAGADPNIRTAAGSSIIWQAATHGNLPTLQRLIAAGADVNFANSRGSTPLSVASQGGFLDIVRALLEAGAEVNHRLQSGNTSLFHAARDGHLEVVRLLLAHGADPTLSARPQHPPLVIAARGRHWPVVLELLPTATPGGFALESTLEQAAEAGHVPTVQAVIDAGVTPVAEGAIACLEVALAHGNNDCARLLRDAGWTVPVINPFQSRAFAQVGWLDPDMVEWLLDLGFSANASDDDGTSALMLAANQPGPHCPKIMQLLMQRGADIWCSNKQGFNAVCGAVAVGIDQLRALLSALPEGTSLHGMAAPRLLDLAMLHKDETQVLPLVHALLRAGVHTGGIVRNGSTTWLTRGNPTAAHTQALLEVFQGTGISFLPAHCIVSMCQSKGLSVPALCCLLLTRVALFRSVAEAAGIAWPREAEREDTGTHLRLGTWTNGGLTAMVKIRLPKPDQGADGEELVFETNPIPHLHMLLRAIGYFCNNVAQNASSHKVMGLVAEGIARAFPEESAAHVAESSVLESALLRGVARHGRWHIRRRVVLAMAALQKRR